MVTANDARHEAIRAAVLAILPETHPGEELRRFYDLLREYPSRSGKGIRGLATLLATEAHGAPWTHGLGAAAGLEAFQNWVLIHDDIEDDSDIRRGLPALHKKLGIPIALNIGDALHAYMWESLLNLTFDHPCGRQILNEFVWIIHRTVEGQHLDLTWVEEGRFDIEEQDYLEMVYLKTACYTAIGPLRLGAWCAELEPSWGFHEAGRFLGCAFQIRDDVLNLLPETTTGKEFAGDLYEAKRTLILAHLFAHASNRERQEIRDRLSRPRRERRAEDVDRILTLVNGYGSLHYAQEIAESLTREGLDKLRNSVPDPPDPSAFHRLELLFESVAIRSS